eukprot:gb/GECG01014933.1/.p1 GENE.gb/GECG01014933.1/~~gb/GECG01014933.1/.p1  ORF type:complete len:158 (+),score=19.97 gb/GECG01014933.1/:1-474(+)
MLETPRTLCLQQKLLQLLNGQMRILTQKNPEFPTPEERTKLCEVLLHCADLSGQVMPMHLAKEWSGRITAEFARQSVLEKKLNIEETPHMRGLETEKAQQELQIGFCDYVVAPLWRALSDVCPDVCPCVAQLERNSEEYKRLTELCKNAEEQPESSQ